MKCLTDPTVPADVDVRRVVSDMMWSEETDKLYEQWRCTCCCHEHTFRNCPARLWYGCRGN